MPYIGNDIQFGELTSQTFTGDGSTVAFTMGYSVANTTSILVTSGNVVQEPTVAYTVSGTTLTFTSAPEDDDTIHVRFLGRVVDVANAAILQDSDQDTKVQVEESADEDTIRFDIAGAEDFTMTANSFNVLAGSSIDMNGTELILDADADTTITADTDDTIDIKIAGADDFKFTANDFTALSGSVISTNTIAETTAASGVTIDGALVKDGAITFASGSSALGYYQEGTFTPGILAGTTDIESASGTGIYTRTGNVAYVQMILRVNRGTTTGILSVTGLPFTVIASTNAQPSWLLYDNGDAYNSGRMPGLIFGANQTIINFYSQPKTDDWGLAGLNASEMFKASSQSYINISGSYIVA